MADGSLATQVEDDLIAKLKAITWGSPPVSLFRASDVLPWPGSETDPLQMGWEEVFKERGDTVAWVRYGPGDSVEVLTANEKRLRPGFQVFIGLQNYGPGGAARRGDAKDAPGLNVMRELVFKAIDTLAPSSPAQSLGRIVDEYNITSMNVVYNVSNAAILMVQLEARDMPVHTP